MRRLRSRALRNEVFVLYPDFPQGGIMDVADYNDGLRGGRVRVRAKIEQVPRRNMVRITEIPFGTTAGSIQDSIVAANDKGKIKVQKVEDNTAEFVEILVHLPGGTDPEQAIQALYAFTDCEVSISVNAVVIQDDKPRFISVTELLRESAAHTKEVLKQRAGNPARGTRGEVALQLAGEDLHREAHLPRHRGADHLGRRDRRHLEGLEALSQAAEARGDRGGHRAADRDQDQAHLQVQLLRGRRGHQGAGGRDRRDPEAPARRSRATPWRTSSGSRRNTARAASAAPTSRASSASTAAEVALADETLYLDAKEGFAGIGLKREGEPVGKCSMLDEVLFITREGVMSVVKVAPKFHVGKNPCHVAIFKRDEQAVYSMIYRDGRQGRIFAKRFRVGGVTRDKEYPLASETPGTKVLYFERFETEEESNARPPRHPSSAQAAAAQPAHRLQIRRAHDQGARFEGEHHHREFGGEDRAAPRGGVGFGVRGQVALSQP